MWVWMLVRCTIRDASGQIKSFLYFLSTLGFVGGRNPSWTGMLCMYYCTYSEEREREAMDHESDWLHARNGRKEGNEHSLSTFLLPFCTIILRPKPRPLWSAVGIGMRHTSARKRIEILHVENHFLTLRHNTCLCH